jgi:hypothetical protein
MRTTKLLALAAVALVAVACNGISPSAPDATLASNDASGLVGAQALNEAIPAPTCRDITRVQLDVSRVSPRGARIQATYFSGHTTVACKLAPQWSSRPEGRIARTRNPFVVNVRLTRPPDAVQVIARAPNGVVGSILVQ